jgi:hypothetical protein
VCSLTCRARSVVRAFALALRRRFDLTFRDGDVAEAEGAKASRGNDRHRPEPGQHLFWQAEIGQHVDPHGGIVVVVRVEPRMHALPVSLDEAAQHGHPLDQTGQTVRLEQGLGEVDRCPQVFRAS